MATLTTRSRTFLFIQYRNSFGHSHRRKRRVGLESNGLGSIVGAAADSGESIEHAGLIENAGEAGGGETVIEMSVLPPQWVDIVEEINDEMEEIKQNIKELDTMHKRHLLPGFDDRSHEEDEINRMTHAITAKFQQCQRRIKDIESVYAHGQETIIGKNIRMSLATKLQDMSSNFRAAQSAYLKKISERKNIALDVFSSSQVELASQDPGRQFDMTLTESQIQTIENDESAILERESEIKHIHESITELSQIFARLQEMVIVQGTMIDRIDYNIENTTVNTLEAAKELDQAEKYQRSSMSHKLIIGLAIFA
ncbi:Integral membrane protein SED5, partial [Spiromyces aspiralis]